MKMHPIVSTVFVAITVLTAASLVRAGEGHKVLIAAEETAKPKVKPYPLDNCIVSDDKWGEMGKPVVFTHKGREIKLCCKPCRKDFDKDPAKYLKKLEPNK